MSAGRVALPGRVNTSSSGARPRRVGVDRDGRREDQLAADVVRRGLEQAAASLVVIAFAGCDAPVVLEMLGISS